MPSPFNAVHEASSRATDRLTLVNGRCFSITDGRGSILRPTDGTVFEDVRMLSRFVVDIGSAHGDTDTDTVHPIQRLAVSEPTPFHHVIVSRPDPSSIEGTPTETHFHRHWVGRGARHDIEIRNDSDKPMVRNVTVEIDTDFAHIFDVKSGVGSGRTTSLDWHGTWGALIDPHDDDLNVRVSVDPGTDVVQVAEKRLRWTMRCPARSNVSVSIGFEPVWDGRPAGALFPIGAAPHASVPAQRQDRWQRLAPHVLTTDRRVSESVETSLADLASLRIFDPDHPHRTVVAAGAPWFMTLFGRDSLITSWMALPFAPELATGVLAALAELQGTTSRPENEEEPGKIIHELRRRGGSDAFAERGRYYGTIDATPLFVMLAGEAHRWGHLDGDALAELWPHVESALDWVTRRIDTDPTGFVRYQRSTSTGLLNQGWKDSWDGVTFADGRIPSGPIALSEVQGYAYAALTDGARLARAVGADVDTDSLIDRAHRLRERFDDAFWVAEQSAYALGVTADGSHIDAITTNPGHALWCGLADADRANRYLDRVMDDAELWSGWGLRTLSPTCTAYNPLSYHNGSVWPHDTALVAAGAATVGRSDVVDTIVDAAFEAASRKSGRPPELFAGIGRSVVDVPVDYPDSCSPQAWSSASTLMNVRSALDLRPPADPSGPPRAVRTGASLGVAVEKVSGVRVGDRRYDLIVEQEHLAIVATPQPGS